MRDQGATLTPALSLAEGEGAIPIPSPPEGERARVRGAEGLSGSFANRRLRP
jgi:hypothetical protein